MKIPLSGRLLGCAKYIHNGDRVADVGCDHGYLGIYLLEHHIASSIIAADINPMPLQSAKANAEKYGYSDKMSFYLSNGVQCIPHNFDVLVCAGMGADTMISILQSAPWLKASQYRMVLQCQSKTPLLRKYLSDNGWCITEESVIRDGRFLYTVMQVLWQPDSAPLSAAECYFPPAILYNPSDKVPAYYKWIIDGLRIQNKHQNDPQKQAILIELEMLSDTISKITEESI